MMNLFRESLHATKRKKKGAASRIPSDDIFEIVVFNLSDQNQERALKTVMFLVIPAEREIPVQLIVCGTQVLLFFLKKDPFLFLVWLVLTTKSLV